MNKEEALSKLCQYSMCNYKNQIWAPEAKELLDYWKGVEKQIKDLIKENQELKKQQKEFIEYLTSYIDLLSNKPDLIEEAEIDILEEILSKYKSIIGGKE